MLLILVKAEGYMLKKRHRRVIIVVKIERKKYLTIRYLRDIMNY